MEQQFPEKNIYNQFIIVLKNNTMIMLHDPKNNDK